MSDLPLKATLKAGTGYDAPWLTVDATDPTDLENKLTAIANGGALGALVGAANALKAANNAGPLLPQGQEAQPPQQQAPQGAVQPAGWATSPPQAEPSWAAQPQQQAQPAPVQQQSRPAPSRPGAQLHPVGEACHCGKVLEHAMTRTNKAQWKCPDYRWNNGSPNEHRLEWAN